MADPRDLFDLTGRVACVTGASSGLGRRAALVLARAGASVVGIARREDQLKDWADEVGERAAYLTADLAARDGIADLAAEAAEPFGAPDIVVHAAGINTREPADEVTAEGWDITLALNLSVPFFGCSQLRHAL